MGAFLYFSGVAFLSVGDPEQSLDVSGMQKSIMQILARKLVRDRSSQSDAINKRALISAHASNSRSLYP